MSLTTIRERKFLLEKIRYWNKIALWLRTTQDCNGDYESYKEIEKRIGEWKRVLKFGLYKIERAPFGQEFGKLGINKIV